MNTVREVLGRRLLVAVAAAVTALGAPAMAEAAPTGLFEGNYAATSNTISEFQIGSGNLLTPGGTVATGGDSWLLAASPNGKYLYGTDFSSGTVSQYTIAGATLTPISPAAVTTGANPEQIAVSPDGKNVYVADESSAGLHVYNVGAGGALSPLQTVTTDLTDPSGVAVSPDGSSVYVASYSGAITEFNRSSSGTLTPKSAATVPTVLSEDINLAMTPNGKYLYASGSNSLVIEGYAVGSGGELSDLTQSTAPEGQENYLLTVSPNGKNLYAASCTTGGIYQYSIASTGGLTPLTPAFVPTAGGCPYDQWMTADGSALYAPDSNAPTGDVSQFTVSSSGALSPKSPASVPAGYDADDVMIAPDQGPVAKFAFKAASAGKATTFNASKSSDSDGTVASYHWSFGDGQTLTTTKAKVSHTYKKAGKHKVTLTVTDDSGCSTTQVFTGQTAYCNGTNAARTSHTVKIAAATKTMKLAVSPNRAKAGRSTCYAFTASSKGHGVNRASIKLAGHTARTGATGKATLCLTLKKGTYTARATKKGYSSAGAKITISAAGPTFTG